ncbi:unknown protein [Seminavis robusta]|uniref:Uncharacterized protein n=1 Tax=Seminavis robusta TaxID=568900 RepID=A0A9N8EGZ6_9STRA|nr:unknown protein [Seminavis robusta]|eukprot:Sro1149_g246601.1  (132) ;mRNA; r:29395-29790
MVLQWCCLCTGSLLWYKTHTPYPQNLRNLHPECNHSHPARKHLAPSARCCHSGGLTLMAILKPFDNAAYLIGNGAVVFCILMFAGPLGVIRLVLQTKSAKTPPLPFTVLARVNCFLWTIVGWFKLMPASTC